MATVGIRGKECMKAHAETPQVHLQFGVAAHFNIYYDGEFGDLSKRTATSFNVFAMAFTQLLLPTL
jgi:hypothetical protein